MTEMRRVRFGNIEGLTREHLGTAGEIWLRDLVSSVWATREAMKLGALLARYMIAPDPAMLALSAIESQIQLGRNEVKLALRLLQLYRVIEAFNFEKEQLRAALHLTTQQRLEALETHQRLKILIEAAGTASSSAGVGERWLPPPDAERQSENALKEGRRLSRPTRALKQRPRRVASKTAKASNQSRPQRPAKTGLRFSAQALRPS